MGRLRFTQSEIDELRVLLGELRRAEPTRQKTIRTKMRRIGFYITDVSHDGDGFSDFDALTRRGRYDRELTRQPKYLWLAESRGRMSACRIATSPVQTPLEPSPLAGPLEGGHFL
jgi:hypothetical protein